MGKIAANDCIKLAISEVPQYLMHLLDLVIGPKTFLASRCTPDADATNKATIFSGISLLIAFILQLPGLRKQVNPASQFALLIANELVVMVVTVLALRGAWRLVGGTATVRQPYICTAYIVGPMFFIFLSCLLTGDAVFRLIDPDGHALLHNNPLATLPQASLEKHGSSVMLFALLAGVVGSLIWLIAVQGAYRALNGVSRARSVAAFVVFQIIQIPLLVFAFALALTQLPSATP